MNEGSDKEEKRGNRGDGTFVMEHRRFTNTALLVFSGTECWFQHFHIVQAIMKSSGWPEETAALQLFVHLKGEALNVALLLTKEKRDCSTSPDNDWYTNIGCIGTLYRTQHSTRVELQNWFIWSTGPWLLPNSHIYASRFHHRGICWVKCQVPRVDVHGITKTPRRVSFVPVCQTSTGEPTLWQQTR